MKSIKKVLLYGFFIWLLPFIVAVIIFPLRTSNRALFETIMPVTVTLCVVLFSVLYFKKLEEKFLKEGIILGAAWFGISLAIDLLMFSRGPMQMAFADYMMDIGLTYLIIPIVTIGFGLLIEKKPQNDLHKMKSTIDAV